MKKRADKILIAIMAIVVVCIITEVPLLAKHQEIRHQKIEQHMKEWKEKQQSLENDSIE